MASSRSKPPEVLAERLASAFRGLPAARLAPLHLCVAFSGGLDSTVLLHLLVRLRAHEGFQLSAAHVHHGLSTQADSWAAHCRQTCEDWAVPVSLLRVDVTRDHSGGLEAAAREARYTALSALDADWLVLAHHADDQAETLLFRLIRGAGVRGAAAMREIDAGAHRWRPLLATPREELETYARAHALVWVEDDSNPDRRFARNYLRHEVLAPLRRRFPAAVSNLARSTELFAESDGLLTELAREDAVQVRLGMAGSRERIRALSAARARNLMRYWLSTSGSRLLPEHATLDEGLRQMLTFKAIRWVFHEVALCAYRDCLWIEPARLIAPQCRAWQGEDAVTWGEGMLHLPKRWSAGDRYEVRSREPGLHWRLDPSRPRREFKLLCQDAGVPPWWRDALPCVWKAGELVWVGGLSQQGALNDLSSDLPHWQGGWQLYQERSAAMTSCGSDSPSGNCR